MFGLFPHDLDPVQLLAVGQQEENPGPFRPIGAVWKDVLAWWTRALSRITTVFPPFPRPGFYIVYCIIESPSTVSREVRFHSSVWSF